MDPRHALIAVSAGQLLCGGIGMALAVQRRHAYDLPFRSGDPDAVARDALFMGTALSAPMPMLVAQAAAIARLARGPDRQAAAALRLLGAAMATGYLGERLVRRRLRPSGWDGAETPVAIVGLCCAGAMAVVGPRG